MLKFVECCITIFVMFFVQMIFFFFLIPNLECSLSNNIKDIE